MRVQQFKTREANPQHQVLLPSQIVFQSDCKKSTGQRMWSYFANYKVLRINGTGYHMSSNALVSPCPFPMFDNLLLVLWLQILESIVPFYPITFCCVHNVTMVSHFEIVMQKWSLQVKITSISITTDIICWMLNNHQHGAKYPTY